MAPPEEREWLIVGRVMKPHGVRGDLLVEIITDFPERLRVDVRFGLGSADGPTSFHEAHAVRMHSGRWLLSVRGIRSRDPIEAWRGEYVFLPEQTLDELPEGYYYEHHLVGLRCEDTSGTNLGEVTGIDDSGGQTRLLVRQGRREFLVPYVPSLVAEVDLEGGRLVLTPIPGLLDDDFLTA